jgi:hypothetical protein
MIPIFPTSLFFITTSGPALTTSGPALANRYMNANLPLKRMANAVPKASRKKNRNHFYFHRDAADTFVPEQRIGLKLAEVGQRWWFSATYPGCIMSA